MEDMLMLGCLQASNYTLIQIQCDQEQIRNPGMLPGNKEGPFNRKDLRAVRDHGIEIKKRNSLR